MILIIFVILHTFYKNQQLLIINNQLILYKSIFQLFAIHN